MDARSRFGILNLAIHSTLQFLRLVESRSICLRHNRIGKMYRIVHAGNSTYTVFRETESRDGRSDPLSVLVVGFRLKMIGSNTFLHWMFQRVCITSTPIWSGFAGFRTKLWLVDQNTKNYLGIYEWAGENNARTYAEWLGVILSPLSKEGSVWYELYSNQDLDSYVRARASSFDTSKSVSADR